MAAAGTTGTESGLQVDSFLFLYLKHISNVRRSDVLVNVSDPDFRCHSVVISVGQTENAHF